MPSLWTWSANPIVRELAIEPCQVDALARAAIGAGLTGQNGDARVGSKVIDINRLMRHWKPIVSLCCFRL